MTNGAEVGLAIENNVAVSREVGLEDLGVGIAIHGNRTRHRSEEHSIHENHDKFNP